MRGRDREAQRTQAFEELTAPLLGALYRVAVQKLRDAHQAEDLVQEVCLKAYRAFDHFEQGSNYRAWLFRILTNTLLDLQRKASKIPLAVDLDPASSFSPANNAAERNRILDPEQQLMAASLAHEVHIAIADLPLEWPAVVLLSVVEGFSYEEIADILVGAVPIGLTEVSMAATSANAGAVGPAFIVPLFPQKEKDLKKGLPSGMTEYSFWAARGTMALSKLADGQVQIAFDFEGLIPYGVYTLWNVLETEPFKDEPLGEFGYGKHSMVADGTGKAQKVVALDKWPGKEVLLDYHADGQLSQSKGVYPGALWGRFPPEPKR